MLEQERKKQRDKYHNRRKAGICTDCGKTPPLTGRLLCFTCKRRHQEKSRNYRLRHSYQAIKRKYGLTGEQYNILLQTQNGLCALCGTSPRSLCVDHDHNTGRVRALLCKPCNVLLGQVENKPLLIEKMISYLATHTVQGMEVGMKG